MNGVGQAGRDAAARSNHRRRRIADREVKEFGDALWRLDLYDPVANLNSAKSFPVWRWHPAYRTE
jgi:hypothetical protein